MVVIDSFFENIFPFKSGDKYYLFNTSDHKIYDYEPPITIKYSEDEEYHLKIENLSVNGLILCWFAVDNSVYQFFKKTDGILQKRAEKIRLEFERFKESTLNEYKDYIHNYQLIKIENINIGNFINFVINNNGGFGDIDAKFIVPEKSNIVLIESIKLQYKDNSDTDEVTLRHYVKYCLEKRKEIEDIINEVDLELNESIRALPPTPTTGKSKKPEVKFENKFNGITDYDLIKEQFIKLTELKSGEDKKPTLTVEQLDYFLKSVFIDNIVIKDKIKMNYKTKERSSIIAIFHEFYKYCKHDYEPTTHSQKKYKELLSNYFLGFESFDFRS